jgi:hypothetical protein
VRSDANSSENRRRRKQTGPGATGNESADEAALQQPDYTRLKHLVLSAQRLNSAAAEGGPLE